MVGIPPKKPDKGAITPDSGVENDLAVALLEQEQTGRARNAEQAILDKYGSSDAFIREIEPEAVVGNPPRNEEGEVEIDPKDEAPPDNSMSLFGEPDTEANFRLFEPAKASVIETKPSTEKNTVLSSLELPDEDTVLETDRTDREINQFSVLSKILFDPASTPEEKTQKLKEATNIKVRSLGEIYADKAFPDMDAVFRENFAEEINVILRNKENKDLIAKTLSDMDISWDEFANKPNQTVEALHDNLVGEKGFIAKNLAKVGEQPAGPLATFGEPGTIKTVGDFARWLNLTPTDDMKHVDWAGVILRSFDFSRPETWYQGWLGNALSDKEFTKQMEGRYGQDWKTRVLAFTAKEIGVDAAILVGLSLFPATRAVSFAGRGAPAMEKFLAAMVRSGALGVGGASVQSTINMIANQDPNFATEFLGRFFGNIAGEGVVAAARMVGGGALSYNATLEIAKRKGLEVMTPEMHRRIIDINNPKSPLFSAITRASLHNYSKEYMRLAKEVSDSVASPWGVKPTPEMQAIRKNVSDLTGIPDNQLETQLGLGRYIFNKDEFINIPFGEHMAKAELKEMKFEPELTRAAERLTKIQDKIAKTRERYDTVPVKTKRAEKQRNLRMAQLEKQLESAQKRHDKIAARVEDARLTQKTIKEIGGDAPFTSGSEIADRVVMSEAIGFQLMGKMQQRQSKVQDLFVSYFDDVGNFQHRPIRGNYGGKQRLAFDLLGISLTEPDKMGLRGVGADYYDAADIANRYGKTLENMVKEAYTGLSRKESGNVDRILIKGSDEERIFTVNELDAEGLTPKEQDAYFAVRKSLDFAHTIMDISLLKEFAEKNVKQFRGITVNVISRPDSELTPAKIKAGYVRIKEVRQRGTDKPAPIEGIVHKSQLEDITTVLPSHAGYVPIVYKDARFHVTKLSPTGGVARLGAFPRIKDAIKFMREAEKGLKGGEALVYSEWNSRAGTGSAGVFNRSMGFFDIADEAGLEAIKKELESMGIAEKQVRIFLDHLDLTSMRRAHIGARASRRLEGPNGKPAEMAATKEAILEYMQAVAQRAGTSEWRLHAIQSFKKDYEEVLNPNVTWSNQGSILDPTSVPFDKRHLITEAKEMREFLLRTISGRTRHERMVDGALNGLEARLIQKNTFLSNSFAKAIDAIPSLSSVIRHSRGIAAWNKLLAFNPAQLFVQGSQALVNFGINPVHAVGAVQDAMLAMTALDIKRLGVERLMSREMEQLFDVAKRSGYFNDLSTLDVTSLATIIDGGKIRKGINRANIVSQLPFRLGEATNRGLAFFTARRVLIDRAAKRQLMGLDGKPFKGKIDDDEFIRLILERARTVALNMGRSGQLHTFSGVGSAAFQFKQVLPKAINLFRTDTLSHREKFGAAAVMLGFWGFAGIPLLSDLVSLAEYGVWEVSGEKPTMRRAFHDWANKFASEVTEYILNDKDFIQRHHLDKGIIKAITNGQVDVTNRVALGKFIEESISIMHWQDAVPVISVYYDLIDAADRSGANVVNIATFLEGVTRYMGEQLGQYPKGTYKEFFNEMTGFIPDYLTGEISWKQAVMGIGNEFGQANSILGSVIRTLDYTERESFDPNFRAFDPGETRRFRSAEGTELPVINLTTSELMQSLLAVTPGRIVDAYEFQNIQRTYKKAIEDYRSKQLFEFKKERNPARRLEIMVDTIRELQSVKHMIDEKGFDLKMAQDIEGSVIQSFNKALMPHEIPAGLVKE